MDLLSSALRVLGGDASRLEVRRLRGRLHSAALLVVLSALLGFTAWWIGGKSLLVPTLVGLAVLYALTPRITPWVLLRVQRCRPIEAWQAPSLTRAVADLARRAGLSSAPVLFRTPERQMNAFTVGDRDHAAIALSDGLLSELSPREVEAVLAHEVSHVANGDMRLKGFADLVQRLTHVLTRVGLLLVFLNLPLIALGEVRVSWMAIGLLLATPMVSSLVLLAFSRSRELEADATAVGLLGEGRTLASALVRIERQQRHMLSFLRPGAVLVPEFLRTHPATEERIRRLVELDGDAPRGAPCRRPEVGVSYADATPAAMLRRVPYVPRRGGRLGPRLLDGGLFGRSGALRIV